MQLNVHLGKTNDTAQTVKQAGVAWVDDEDRQGRQRQREVEISQDTLETLRMEDFEVPGLHNARSSLGKSGGACKDETEGGGGGRSRRRGRNNTTPTYVE